VAVFFLILPHGGYELCMCSRCGRCGVHPFFAVLARPDHVPFLAAHQARNVDIWLLVLVVAVLLPAALLALLWLVHRVSKAFGFAGFVTVLGSLTFLALVPVFGRWLHGSPVSAAVLAVLAAASLTLFYLRKNWFGTFVTILASAAVLSPAPARAIVGMATGATPSRSAVKIA
jgi:hypothetical protein